jgi:hypothetical protein
MHTIFAIEPEAINNWPDLRYAVEKFGFSKGLLIGRYPKRWVGMVYEACEANVDNDIELKKIEEKLSLIKLDRLFKLGLPYINPEAAWLTNASSDQILQHLDGLLVNGDIDEQKHYQISTVGEEVFENRREVQVKRQASTLASAATCILQSGTSINMVDPYFQPRNKCIKVINEMLNITRNSNSALKFISIFTSNRVEPRPLEEVKELYRGLLTDWIDLGFSFEIYRLNEDELDLDLHARYLFTDAVGLRFDRGFVEPEDHFEREHLTDVVCMDNQRVRELHKLYIEDSQQLQIVDCIKLGN